MGDLVDIICDCGYQAEMLSVGGGFLDFNDVCHFPCLCLNCKEIVNADVFQKPITCPKCHGQEIKPYDHPSLIGEQGEEIIADWHVEEIIGRALVLTDGKYYCPKCEQYSLSFLNSGCFD